MYRRKAFSAERNMWNTVIELACDAIKIAIYSPLEVINYEE
jgi:hypothetical protein